MRTAKAAAYEAPNTPFVMKEFPLRPVPHSSHRKAFGYSARALTTEPCR
jgi:hypothetical protein